MKVPNANSVLVEREKIADYILNREHPQNGGKADFFIALGLSRSNWVVLVSALRDVAACSPVARSMESVHGRKYIVDGAIETPVGKKPLVRTVWIVDTGETIPRLVTAYPHEE